jgi:hypothetical protein
VRAARADHELDRRTWRALRTLGSRLGAEVGKGFATELALAYDELRRADMPCQERIELLVGTAIDLGAEASRVRSVVTMARERVRFVTGEQSWLVAAARARRRRRLTANRERTT